ncbi:MAG: hypothetical protein A3A43_02805 [Candidatus Liptonbacteria bacterium RIFCSPLOWO2_01_FULL_56_20]|uniref:Glutamate/phenylalanine/leucine/valine/L-tryptophan dehydrogenase C-terminal domain-containing protein n=1 Tax=Candidatus Liptonbacteria bacterium RIFCSPLOWO2_01_FULL_56_20 TaxID=1798652 RepID=A0A1G2CLX7_9BACT|nr:MAG: hypothetical protein A2681_01740 [Candidatus Liptonbacteria bacterium RIFCSPHIGHO2_01_FULL_56_18b]OGZ01428.1 MAG: hypothetical protein A3A43_02805 [Candidatus Liptonbacteria bacterium RIFCSPLOWO2_01_FULL_56_20]
MREFSVSSLPEFDNHELVAFFEDKKTGLKSFVAVHNTNLGPATGGTRYWNYRSEREALRDALRLSQAMTYKCALAGLSYGGGKGVIMANSHNPKKRKFLIAYAKRVNLLRGNFYTGEDVGLTTEYVNTLARHSKFIIGRESLAGNPSPWAALGVFYAISAGLKAVFGTDEMSGRTFSIKGVGKVGSELCRLLYGRGGRIVVADINQKRIKQIKKRFPKVRVVKPGEIHEQRVDVYAPCALGDEFNAKTIPRLQCHIVCGGANNQLSTSEDGRRLQRAGILYIPDYLANAGGLINVVAELDRRGYSWKRVRKRVQNIQKMARKVIEFSRRQDTPTSEVADRLAESIFRKKSKG